MNMNDNQVAIYNWHKLADDCEMLMLVYHKDLMKMNLAFNCYRMAIQMQRAHMRIEKSRRARV